MKKIEYFCVTTTHQAVKIREPVEVDNMIHSTTTMKQDTRNIVVKKKIPLIAVLTNLEENSVRTSSDNFDLEITPPLPHSWVETLVH
jgi:hypothetical protein